MFHFLVGDDSDLNTLADRLLAETSSGSPADQAPKRSVTKRKSHIADRKKHEHLAD